MPFPWKKMKYTKISELVKNHVKSQRNRSSPLVVETGFPTSIVDLVVKNHENFRKSSKKKMPFSSPPPPPPPPSSSSESLISSSPSSSPSPSTLPLPSASPTSLVTTSSTFSSPSTLCLPPRCVVKKIPSRGVKENLVGEGGKGRGDVEACANGVLVAVAKIFLVVVLALGAKKFAAGVTVSAFLLLFVEYAGRYLYRLCKPCTEVQRSLSVVAERFWKFLGFRGCKLDGRNGVSAAHLRLEESCYPGCSSTKILGLTDPISEIQRVKPIGNDDSQSPTREIRMIELKWCLPDQPNEISPAIEKVGDSGCLDAGKRDSDDLKLKSLVGEEEESLCEEPELKRRKSRRAKIKSKMKKLVPKKLRRSKKKSSDSETNLNAPVDGKVAILEEEKELDHYGNEEDLDYDTKSSSLSSESYDSNEAYNHQSSECDRRDALVSSSQGPEDASQTSVSLQESGEPTNKNSGYLILCLIVLVGLFAGRAFALLFTLACCIGAKFGLSVRESKLPNVRSCAPSST